MADKKTAKTSDVSVAAKELAAAETAVQAKPAEKKPTAAAAEKKPAAAAAAKKPAAKKPAAKKETEAKKPAAKKPAAAAKKDVVKSAFIQDNYGNSKTFDDVVAQATANFKETHKRVAVKKIEVYIKAVENKVYYVVNGTEQGEMNLF